MRINGRIKDGGTSTAVPINVIDPVVTGDDPSDPNEPWTNRLAALIRDCMILLLMLAFIVWLLFVGIKAIATQHLHLVSGIPSDSWFDNKPLDGFRAVLAGFSFLSLAAAFASGCVAHPWISKRVPWWRPSVGMWFVVLWALLYFTAGFA